VATGATAYVDVTLTDYTATAHGSDALAGLNWDLADFDDSFFYAFIEVTGAGPLQYVEFQGTIDSIVSLPEPSLLALLGFGAAAAVATRTRG
jgi:hypothetical protein